MSEISIITRLAGPVPVGQLAVMAFGVGNTVYQAAKVTQRCRGRLGNLHQRVCGADGLSCNAICQQLLGRQYHCHRPAGDVPVSPATQCGATQLAYRTG